MSTKFSSRNSKLTDDIHDIINNKNITKPSIEMEVKIHTELKDLNVNDGISLDEVFIFRDYVNNVTDYIELTVKIRIGTYIHDIYDYLDNIEISLIYHDQLYKNKKPIKKVDRYKAIYLIDQNKNIPTILNGTKEDLEYIAPITVKFQLLDRSVEAIRIKTTQGVFSDINGKSTITNFLTTVISDQCNKIRIENKPVIDGIEIEKPDNISPLTSVTIPSGTRIIDLPSYYQNKSHGVYSSDIGTYIQIFENRKIFFVYSLYNSVKYKKQEYKVIFYAPIDNVYTNADKTYDFTDKILKAIINPIKYINDNKDTFFMSDGSGIRISNANSFMKKPVIITPNGPKFKKSGLNTEIVLKNKKDGINYAPVDNISTANLFSKLSNLVKKAGSTLTLTWNNSNHNYLYPGQACKIVYEDKVGKLKEITATILKVEVIIRSESQTEITKFIGKTSYSSVATITVFIDGLWKEFLCYYN